jgi:hypothetical protein
MGKLTVYSEKIARLSASNHVHHGVDGPSHQLPVTILKDVTRSLRNSMHDCSNIAISRCPSHCVIFGRQESKLTYSRGYMYTVYSDVRI